MEHQILIVLPVLPDRSPKPNPLVVWGARSRSLHASRALLFCVCQPHHDGDQVKHFVYSLYCQYCSLWYCTHNSRPGVLLSSSGAFLFLFSQSSFATFSKHPVLPEAALFFISKHVLLTMRRRSALPWQCIWLEISGTARQMFFALSSYFCVYMHYHHRCTHIESFSALFLVHLWHSCPVLVVLFYSSVLVRVVRPS